MDPETVFPARLCGRRKMSRFGSLQIDQKSTFGTGMSLGGIGTPRIGTQTGSLQPKVPSYRRPRPTISFSNAEGRGSASELVPDALAQFGIGAEGVSSTRIPR